MDLNDAGDSKVGTTGVNKRRRRGYDDDSFGMDYSVRFARWLLTPLGVWQLVKTNSSGLERIIGNIARPIALFYMILGIIPTTAEILAQRASRSELIMFVAPLTFQVSNLLKHLCMLFRRDVIKMSLEHMEADWARIDNEKDGRIMIDNIRIGHRLAIIVTVCIYSGSSLYNLFLPALAEPYVNEFNQTIRGLSHPGGDLFFDVQANGVYPIVFLNYYLASVSTVTVSMGQFNLALVLVRHTCGQIQIVIGKLENLVNPDQDIVNVLIENPVAVIIQSHARLLKFSTHIEKILQEICGLEFVCDTLLLCFLGYNGMADFDKDDAVTIFTYVMLEASIAVNLFMYCQIGEVLKEQCENLGRAAYMIDWYKLPTKTGLDLIMIMNVSAQPPQLTAGGMMQISRVSYTNIMKTSFAYLNMLRTMA